MKINKGGKQYVLYEHMMLSFKISQAIQNVRTYYALHLFEPLSSGKSVGVTNVLICKRSEIQGFINLFWKKEHIGFQILQGLQEDDHSGSSQI